ncbi:MAG: L-threonylcarbamoyladenylate synthase [Phycisphaerales bacterium]|nr:L-threonylcarbamoyladenylate synthase [Phycisphaerales bacterium]
METIQEDDIQKMISTLKNGGTVLYPTDTIWGIGCLATNEHAVQKVLQIKERPTNKSFIVLVASVDDIYRFVCILDKAITIYLEKGFEKPTTVIYPKGKGVAPSVIAPDGTIAIRVCTDVFCQAVLKKLDQPIVSTSANISGQASPKYFKDISSVLVKRVDYVVRYRQQDTTIQQASAIVQWDGKQLKSIRL